MVFTGRRPKMRKGRGVIREQKTQLCAVSEQDGSKLKRKVGADVLFTIPGVDVQLPSVWGPTG